MREVRVDVHRVLDEHACGALRDILIPIMLQPMGRLSGYLRALKVSNSLATFIDSKTITSANGTWNWSVSLLMICTTNGV